MDTAGVRLLFHRGFVFCPRCCGVWLGLGSGPVPKSFPLLLWRRLCQGLAWSCSKAALVPWWGRSWPAMVMSVWCDLGFFVLGRGDRFMRAIAELPDRQCRHSPGRASDCHGPPDGFGGARLWNASDHPLACVLVNLRGGAQPSRVGWEERAWGSTGQLC